MGLRSARDSPAQYRRPTTFSDPEVPLYTGQLTECLEQDLKKVARNRLAETITGRLSSPGKMPCLSWGIFAARCRAC
jgi:hypothetical protein